MQKQGTMGIGELFNVSKMVLVIIVVIAVLLAIGRYLWKLG